MRLSVQEVEFDAGAELNAFSAGLAGAGAVVSFTGIVRDALHIVFERSLQINSALLLF